MKLEELTIGVSPLTGEVFIGKPNKSRFKWLKKHNVTDEFTQAVLTKYLGKLKTATHTIESGSEKWELTIKKIN